MSLTLKGVAIALSGLALAAGAPAAAQAVVTIWAVGDGATTGQHDNRLARMIGRAKPSHFIYLGDVYESGTPAEFASNYASSFGRLKRITWPTPGNHEWPNHLIGYDAYWGSRFTTPHYYSRRVAGWRILSLNSEEPHGEGSAQLKWLRARLSGHPDNCAIAFFHRPRYSAGPHGDQADIAPLWQQLAGHVAIVLNGHDHDYERLKPIARTTEFVVGTGGRNLYPLAVDRRIVYSNASSYGALQIRLSPDRASYRFITNAGHTLDSGSIVCGRRGVEPSQSRVAPKAG